MLRLRYPSRCRRLLVQVAMACISVGWCSLGRAAESDPRTIDFNQQIRPILNRHCTACHGGVKQAADVSFVYREQSIDAGIIIPGEPDESELIARVEATDPDVRMPPPGDHPEPLTNEEVTLLRQWIEQGAAWGEHWSLRPPVDQLEAARQDSAWPKQPLDHFVLRRLRATGLEPSPEADVAEWARRVSFDLTGLPPTLEQLDELREASQQSDDARDAAYEAFVDNLLGSPHYGERWAAMWMDLARYADTMGFEKDPHRDMWPYRDWLIKAFNQDMPFDEFTLKQLAGDLLENPTTEDLVATAFHRNTQTNTEGGTDDEEFRVAAVIDRVNTTWTVWQATTFGCVQCHSHPYDAFRHHEYYRFLAFFNNTEDQDLDDDYPSVNLSTDSDVRVQTSALLKRQRQLRDQIDALGHVPAGEVKWLPLPIEQAESTHGKLAFDANEVRTAGGTFAPGCEYTIQTPGVSCTAVRLQILPESDNPAEWPEVGSVLSELKLQRVAADGTTVDIAFSQVFADHSYGPFQPERSLHGDAAGFGGYPKLYQPRWAVFVLQEPLQAAEGDALRFTLRQAAQTTGNRAVHIRRLRLDTSNDERWAAFNQDESLQSLRTTLESVTKQLNEMDGPRVPIIQERGDAARRETRVFRRGNFLDRGDAQQPGVPGVLPPIEQEQPTRLELAQWLTSDKHPLTPRVLANRLWAALFGTGIVETLEDFGSTGAAPSHPDLLDHLALRLRDEHHWRLKPFLKELVLSATYRQSQQMSAELRDKDPRNRLLARGPRTRLTAEMIRDQALFASGLLAEAVGGPSVMPPQPEGVWRTVYNNAQWKTAEGADRYRRGLYTYWRRTSPYPSFLMFDAPSREVCSARRVPTNTPLQALVTLNDPVYVESAKALADAALRHAPDDPTTAIQWAYRMVTQREPSPTVTAQLQNLYASVHEDLTTPSDPNAASPSPDTPAAGATHDEPEQAAMAIVTSTILNLDRSLAK